MLLIRQVVDNPIQAGCQDVQPQRNRRTKCSSMHGNTPSRPQPPLCTTIALFSAVASLADEDKAALLASRINPTTIATHDTGTVQR